MIWSIIYLSAVLVANYTAIWFIPFPVFGMVSVGTLIFGATFTARDYVHKSGRKKVYAMIGLAIIASASLSIFGNVQWRVILASTVAVALSETVDTEVYQKLLEKPWLVRVSGSNAISIPSDSLLFNLIAFAGIFSPIMITSIVFGEIVTKYIVGSVVALWRYLR